MTLISDLVGRIMKIAEQSILENGGRSYLDHREESMYEIMLLSDIEESGR
jgi:hypothetical protein